LWSARGTPALRAVARKAHANGKLVCVRLDSASPPVDAGGVHAVRLPRGRAQGAAWRKLLAAKARAVRAEKPERAAAMRLPPRAVRRQVAALPYPASYAKRSDLKLGGFVAGLAAIALVVLAAGTEAYARDPQFAQRIAQLASSAQAQAAELLSAQR